MLAKKTDTLRAVALAFGLAASTSIFAAGGFFLKHETVSRRAAFVLIGLGAAGMLSTAARAVGSALGRKNIPSRTAERVYGIFVGVMLALCGCGIMAISDHPESSYIIIGAGVGIVAVASAFAIDCAYFSSPDLEDSRTRETPLSRMQKLQDATTREIPLSGMLKLAIGVVVVSFLLQTVAFLLLWAFVALFVW